MALDGNILAVGAHSQGKYVSEPYSGRGAVYIYRQNKGGQDSWGTVTVEEDDSQQITLHATDPDDKNSNLSYTIADQPDHGTLSGSGRTRTYEPDDDFYGSDGLTFEVSDGDASDTADFSITVEPVNERQTIDAISDQTIDEDTGPQTVQLTGLSPGPKESQTFDVSAATASDSLFSTLAVQYQSPDAPAALTLEPVDNQPGSATIEVAADETSGSKQTTESFDVRVRPLDDPPAFVPPTPSGRLSAREENELTFTVQAKDPDDSPIWSVFEQSGSSEASETVDNDCDGVVDNIDGGDADECKNGPHQCNQSGDGVTCGTESKTDIGEQCAPDGTGNGKGEDCDGRVDEDCFEQTESPTDAGMVNDVADVSEPG